ncbi:MAG: Fic family protein [Legionella sp.]|uniref:Fic/DOC family protein n=1 Tax=Legionella sp. TaxID=459 RepID=UPI0039E24959
MDNNNRYSVPEDEDYEPGSNNEVLKNLLGIKDKETMEQVEEIELERTGNELPSIYSADYQFTQLDIRQIHKLWLADIYPFAGKYRTVNMSKDGFQFAASKYIDKSMQELERKFLKQYTPCQGLSNKLTEALGIVHIELIVIHPFREGNGRVSRLLANLMAMQAGFPQLNFEPIDKTINPQGYHNYILAIHHGVMGNYEPIQELFSEILRVT